MTENNSTINTGLELVQYKAGNDVNLAKLQIKELGLSVVLLGLAESHAKRVERLSKVIDQLEQEIFDPLILSSLTQEEKIERYNLAMQAIGHSSNYIKGTVNNIDWNSLEIRLRQLTMNNEVSGGSDADTTVNDKQLRDVADMLLREIGRSTRTNGS